ncbi:MAG: CoA pyrophosphatase, partial [Desulfopila sp.]
MEQLQQKLPAVPGIMGREEYVVSAILVPLLCLDGEEHLLFEKRASHIRQGGEICFPGGHFDAEQDTDYLQTALRETSEELGLQQSHIQLVGRLDTLVSPRGIIVECFLGALHGVDVTDLTLDREEVDEVFTVPLRFFAENPPEIYHTRIETQSSCVDDEGKTHVLLPVEQLGLPERYS